MENEKEVKVKKINVSEIFGPTIQGEGSEAGKQTIFLRTAGCDYRCTRCDSLHAVLPELIKDNSTLMTPLEIATKIDSLASPTNCKHVTISGGNPVMWDLQPLLDILIGLNKYTVGVETQGTLTKPWLNNLNVDVTVSPKGPGMGETFEPHDFNHFLNSLHKIPTVKVVVFDQRDIEFLIFILEKWPELRQNCYVSIGNVMPPKPAQRYKEEMGHDEFVQTVLSNTKVIVEEVLKEPRLHGVRVLPQLHTLLWGNEKGK